jgi:hypothetical protein
MEPSDLRQKFDGVLQRYPWEATWVRLCGDPPPPEELPLDDARQIIARERDSQIPRLFTLMLTPIVEPARHPPKRPNDPPRGETLFRLREPRRTARLFLERSVSAGQNLRQFPVEELEQLDDRRDSALGRLLRLLAVADGLPLRERRAYRTEWSNLRFLGADFGPVLTPMLRATTETKPSREANHLQLAELLAARLAEAAERSERSTEDKSLGQWTNLLIRQGAARLRELGADLRA